MLQRNRYWTYGQVVVGGLLGWFLFYIVPKWNAAEEIKQYGNSVATYAIGLGVVVVLIIPFSLMLLVLPAPIYWFPNQVQEIAESRERELLNVLEELANHD